MGVVIEEGEMHRLIACNNNTALSKLNIKYVPTCLNINYPPNGKNYILLDN